MNPNYAAAPIQADDPSWMRIALALERIADALEANHRQEGTTA
jgi:hypothetical protein